MTSVYTNIARKRIAQSQEASQTPPKASEPKKTDSSLTEAKNQSVNQQEQEQERNITTPSSSQNQFQKADNRELHDTTIPRYHDTIQP